MVQTDLAAALPATGRARRRALLLVAGLVVLSAQAAVSLRSFYLATDDWLMVTYGRDAHGVASLFERQTVGPPAIRPISLLKARAEWALFGDRVEPRLAVHLLLHLGCAALLCVAAGALGAGPGGAMLCAALFWVHPTHGEVLAWYHSGHTTLLVTLLTLLSLVAWLRRWPWPAQMVCFAAALLTRENAVMLVGVLAGLAWHAERAVRPALRRIAPYLLIAALWGTARAWQVAVALSEDPAAFLPVNPHPFQASGYALWNLLVPVHPGVPGAWLWLAACLALLGTLRWRRSDRWVWALGWVVLFCLPFLPIYATDDPLFDPTLPGYERKWYYFHLPLAGLAWLWVLGLRGRRTLSAAAVAGFLALQLLNARWYAELGHRAHATFDALGALTARRVPLVFDLDAPGVLTEILEHQVLEIPRAFAEQSPLVYRRKPGEERYVRATRDAFGYPKWAILPATFRPPPDSLHVRWDGHHFVTRSVGGSGAPPGAAPPAAGAPPRSGGGPPGS